MDKLISLVISIRLFDIAYMKPLNDELLGFIYYDRKNANKLFNFYWDKVVVQKWLGLLGPCVFSREHLVLFQMMSPRSF